MSAFNLEHFNPSPEDVLDSHVQQKLLHLKKFENGGIEKLVDKWFDYFYGRQGQLKTKKIIKSRPEYRDYMINRIASYYAKFLSSVEELQKGTAKYVRTEADDMLEMEGEFAELVYDWRYIPRMVLLCREHLEIEDSHHHLATGTEGSHHVRHGVKAKVHDFIKWHFHFWKK